MKKQKLIFKDGLFTIFILVATSTIIDNYDSLKKKQQIKLLKEVNQDTEWLMHMVENLLSVTRIDVEIGIQNCDVAVVCRAEHIKK